MKRYFIVAWAAFLLCACSSLSAQNRGVKHLWGKSIGKAQNDRDFLIYDATCFDNKLFIVGKAESGTDLVPKRGENTYCYEKDDYTDAFLACYSLDGELLWSTYLPALEEGYYNAFASTVGYITDSNHIVVIGNTYQIQGNIERTKGIIPQCSGKLFILELDVTGGLVRQKTFNFSRNDDPAYKDRALPLIRRFVEQKNIANQSASLLGGIAIEKSIKTFSGGNRVYVYSFPVLSEWIGNRLEEGFAPIYFSSKSTYEACQMIHPNLWNFIKRYTENQADSLALSFIDVHDEYDTKNTNKSYFQKLHTGAIDLLATSGIYETWSITLSKHHTTTQYYAYPYGTNNQQHQFLFPGTIQNIHTINDKYLVQGIHCRNYDNGFFKKDGKPYAYSHNTEHLIPQTGGFYQNRNNSHTAVPYLILYDSATLFGTNVSEEDS
ncbi:MAG: hypothetical protein K2H68_03120, partial [Bacteroidales bacterium]|nr:hypothetical protein [Bacteroidales bacterium]